jgi:hypothetical protein
MTTVLNQSLGLIVYQTFTGEHDAICFVGDLARDVDEQAESYMRHEDIDGTILHAYWHNALEDEYGNRYEPKIEQVG